MDLVEANINALREATCYDEITFFLKALSEKNLTPAQKQRVKEVLLDHRHWIKHHPTPVWLG